MFNAYANLSIADSRAKAPVASPGAAHSRTNSTRVRPFDFAHDKLQDDAMKYQCWYHKKNFKTGSKIIISLSFPVADIEYQVVRGRFYILKDRNNIFLVRAEIDP